MWEQIIIQLSSASALRAKLQALIPAIRYAPSSSKLWQGTGYFRQGNARIALDELEEEIEALDEEFYELVQQTIAFLDNATETFERTDREIAQAYRSAEVSRGTANLISPAPKAPGR